MMLPISPKESTSQTQKSPGFDTPNFTENKTQNVTSPEEKLTQLEFAHQQIEDAEKQSKEISNTYDILNTILVELEPDYENDKNLFGDPDFCNQAQKHLQDLSKEYDKQQSRYEYYLEQVGTITREFDKQVKKLFHNAENTQQAKPFSAYPFNTTSFNVGSSIKTEQQKYEKLLERQKQLIQHRKQLERETKKIIEQKEAELEAIAVPDDIVPAGTWITQRNTSDTMPRTYGKLRRLDTYIPHNMNNESISDKDTVAWIVMHGTFGSGTEGYFKDKGVDERNQNYRHMKRAAAWYAFTHKKRVDLLSYKWTGATSQDHRSHIAKIVAEQLNTEYKDSDIVLSGHSHGCNVNNEITHLLNKPAKLLLHFACPVREGQPTNLPEKFEQMLYFYSEGDLVARIGRIYDYKLNSALIGGIGGSSLISGLVLAKNFVCKTLQAIGYNIEFGNPTIEKEVVLGAMAIAAASCEYVLRASIPGTHKFPILSTYNNKIINGFETTINGEQAWHSDVTNMIQFLPEIITKLHRKYPAHYANNALFAVDGQMNETLTLKKPKPVLLAINNAISDDNNVVTKAQKIPFIIKRTPYIKTKTDMDNKDKMLFDDNNGYAKKQNPVKLIGEDYYTTFITVDNIFDQQDVDREKLYSNEQKELFKQIYAKKKKLKKIL